MLGILFGGFSIITGLSVLFDSSCDSVSFGAGGHRILLTCYEAGMSGGFMPGWLAGILAILLGVFSGFVGLASIGGK
jgi:hypothetical protein